MEAVDKTGWRRPRVTPGGGNRFTVEPMSRFRRRCGQKPTVEELRVVRVLRRLAIVGVQAWGRCGYAAIRRTADADVRLLQTHDGSRSTFVARSLLRICSHGAVATKSAARRIAADGRVGRHNMKHIAIAIAGVCCTLVLGCRAKPEPVKAETVSSPITGIQIRPVQPFEWRFAIPKDCDAGELAAEIRAPVEEAPVPAGTVVLVDGALSVHGAEAYRQVIPLLKARQMITDHRLVSVAARRLEMTETFLGSQRHHFEWQLIAPRARASEVIQICTLDSRAVRALLRTAQESPHASLLTMPWLTLGEGEIGTPHEWHGNTVLRDCQIHPREEGTEFSPVKASFSSGIDCRISAQLRGTDRLMVDLQLTQFACRDPRPKPQQPRGAPRYLPIPPPMFSFWPSAPTWAKWVVVRDNGHEVALPVELPAAPERVIGHVQLEVPDGRTIAIRKPGTEWSMPLAKRRRKRRQPERMTEIVLLLHVEIVDPVD